MELKSEWYKKLSQKLKLIQSGKMELDDYLNEVERKIEISEERGPLYTLHDNWAFKQFAYEKMATEKSDHIISDKLMGKALAIKDCREELGNALEQIANSKNVNRKKEGDQSILINGLNSIKDWNDVCEEIWGDPGMCAIEILQEFEKSKLR